MKNLKFAWRIKYSIHDKRPQTFKHEIREDSTKKFTIVSYPGLQNLCAINLSSLWRPKS